MTTVRKVVRLLSNHSTSTS